jgi:fatty-acyl-CoA synthase
MNDVNLGDALEVVAELRGDAPCLIQGERSLSWSEVDRRTRNLAAWMKERGAGHQAKVAIYTYNDPAYMEAVTAAFKAALVPVNVNYRYREEELRYLLENSDTEIVVVHRDFAPLLAGVVEDLPRVKAVAVVGGDDDQILGGLPAAEHYEEIVRADRKAPDVERSGDDLMFLYTGGTTGMPKGVMWRQGDLFARFGGGALAPAPPDLEGFRDLLRGQESPPRTVIGPPLMHGTGWFTALITGLSGGAVVLLPNPARYDAAELLRTIAETRATGLTIVGDPFAKPMLEELRSGGGAYDISSLVLIMSSGVMWSHETKQALLGIHPGLILTDSFSSSEAVGMGISVTTAAGSVNTGKFAISETTRLFSPELELLESKPGVKGLVGVGGAQPLGYYKDPDKSARTFVEAQGQRFSIPGDWAVIEEDGVTLTLLGRGSVCINTGGEKVFPEEVEEVIKRFEGVKDAVVVGVPDEKWGEAVTAVVSSRGEALDPEAVRGHVKESLAGYKCPKHVVLVDEVYRSPSGKADFKRTRATAMQALGIPDA